MRTTYPEEPRLAREVTSAAVTELARELRSQHAITWPEALAWARQCRREWQAATEQAEANTRARNFTRARVRRHAGKLVPAREVACFRPGITRATLTRREKIAENEAALKKGLEPTHTVL